MLNGKNLKEQIMEGFEAFVFVEKQMGTLENLKDLDDYSKVLNTLYDRTMDLLNKLRKEQHETFLNLDKDIISTLSKKNKIIIDCRIRLDSSYDYEEGELEENED